MKRILFLCMQNTARSQMAEAFASRIAPPGVEIASAGFHAAEIHTSAIRVMAEIGYDMTNQKSKSLSELQLDAFDIIVTLCHKTRENCPFPKANPCIVQWDVPEPAPAGEAEEDLLSSFRQTRDIIKKLTEDFFLQGYFKVLISLTTSLHAVMNNFIEGVIVHDNNRIISLFNRAAERITGWKASDVIGRDCRTVFPHGFCGDKCNFCSTDLIKFTHLVYPIEITTRDGVRKSITMSLIPLFDEANTQIGVLATFRDISRVVELEMKLADGCPYPGIISTGKEMQSVFSLIRDIKGSDAPVLIQGETGTGKDLVAHAIHQESRRAARHFVPVNCGALPEGTIESELFGHVRGAFTGAVRDKKGRFELADGGTIFLDEVAELSQSMQVKLLRVLQDGTFERVGGEQTLKADFRIISATNRDIRHMVKTGAFREDLFYRLCVVPIHLPPLRERSNDILFASEFFLKKISDASQNAVPDLSEETIRILTEYRWPGNFRQLQNALQYAVLKCKGDFIEPRHLPQEITAGYMGAVRKQAPGRKRLLDAASVAAAMKEAGGNKAKAARLLDVNRATLYRFIELSQSP